jgi:hypothetical protein
VTNPLELLALFFFLFFFPSQQRFPLCFVRSEEESESQRTPRTADNHVDHIRALQAEVKAMRAMKQEMLLASASHSASLRLSTAASDDGSMDTSFDTGNGGLPPSASSSSSSSRHSTHSTHSHSRRKKRDAASKQDLEDAQVEAAIVAELETRRSAPAPASSSSSSLLSSSASRRSSSSSVSTRHALVSSFDVADSPLSLQAQRRDSLVDRSSPSSSSPTSPRVAAPTVMAPASPVRPSSMAPASPQLLQNAKKPKARGMTREPSSLALQDYSGALAASREAYSETKVSALCSQLSITVTTIPARTTVAMALERCAATGQFALPVYDGGIYATTLMTHDFIGFLISAFKRDGALYVDFAFAQLSHVRRAAGTVVAAAGRFRVDMQSSASKSADKLDMFGLGALIGEAEGPVTMVLPQNRLLRHYADHAGCTGAFADWILAQMPLFETSDAPLIVHEDTPVIDLFNILHQRRATMIGVVNDAGALTGHLSVDAIVTVTFDTFGRLNLPLRRYVGDTAAALRARGQSALATLVDPPRVDMGGQFDVAFERLTRPDNHIGACWIVDERSRPRTLLTARNTLHFLLNDRRFDRINSVLLPQLIERVQMVAATSSTSSQQHLKKDAKRRVVAQRLAVQRHDSFGDFGHRAAAAAGAAAAALDGADDDGVLSDDQSMPDPSDTEVATVFQPSADSSDADASSDDSELDSDSDLDDEESLVTAIAGEALPAVQLLNSSLSDLLRLERPANALLRVLSEVLCELQRRQVTGEDLLLPPSVEVLLPVLEHFGGIVVAQRKAKRGDAPAAAPVAAATVRSFVDSSLARSVSAGTLLRTVFLYLGSLRSPLVPLAHHGYWFTTALTQPGRVRLFRLTGLLLALPAANQVVLGALVPVLHQLVLAGCATFARMAAELTAACVRSMHYAAHFPATPAPSLVPLFCDLLINHAVIMNGMADARRVHAEDPRVAALPSAGTATSKSGTLLKCSRGSRWAARFVRLVGTTLVVCADERSADTPIEVFTLAGASVSGPDKQTAQFDVRTRSKTLQLKPQKNSNASLANEWLTELTRAIKAAGRE